MWETLIHEKRKEGLQAKLFKAIYDGKTLVTWVVFLFNNVIYYPYGASSSLHREVMASNLMMWEMIRLGKREGCTSFDMWGSLGLNPNPKDPWFGFHRFKQGYGAELVECAGSFDLVINKPLYPVYNSAHVLRNIYLRTRALLPR
jgi:lipid II:glycine glycyltransferase (peptidoglycan interpeptide bridge formation enzyme)